MRRSLQSLIGVLAVVTLVGLGCGRQGADGDHASRDAGLELGAPDPVDEIRVGKLRKGSTLQKALESLELSSAEALAIAGAVNEVHSVRSLRVGTPFALTVSQGGSPIRFEIWPELTRGVAAMLSGDEWRAEAMRRDLERYVRYISGQIADNLYESLLAAGGDPSLVLEISDILQWDVDFFVDPRPGDRFTLLVEEWVDGREVIEHGRVLAIRYDGDQASASAYLHRDGDDSGYYHLDGTSVRRSLLKSPLNYRRISSHFSASRLHPILKIRRPHLGVDYAAPTGTPVVALGDGSVEFVGWKGGYGRALRVRHNSRLTTQYAHLSRYAKGMRRGVRVKQGQVIGFVGSSGLATGPHLDFRCEINGQPVDPLTLKRLPAEPIPAAALSAFTAMARSSDRALTRLPRNGFLTWEEFRGYFFRGLALEALDGHEDGSGAG